MLAFSICNDRFWGLGSSLEGYNREMAARGDLHGTLDPLAEYP